MSVWCETEKEPLIFIGDVHLLLFIRSYLRPASRGANPGAGNNSWFIFPVVWYYIPGNSGNKLPGILQNRT